MNTVASAVRSTLLAAVALAVLGLASPARPADRAPEPAAEPAPELAPPVAPLLIDPGDTGLGATVVYTRIPTVAELGDLHWVENIDHVLLALPAWPATFADIAPLGQFLLPEGADLMVVLPGYPATQESAEAWNLLRRRVRIVMVVDGPPVDRGMILTMNAIRGLERVIADMPTPSRSGFQRLQRPLSFRVIRR